MEQVSMEEKTNTTIHLRLKFQFQYKKGKCGSPELLAEDLLSITGGHLERALQVKYPAFLRKNSLLRISKEEFKA